MAKVAFIGLGVMGFPMAGHLAAGETADLALDGTRKAYVHLVRGSLRVNGQALQTGDAAMLDGEALLQWEAASEGALVLVFDLRA